MATINRNWAEFVGFLHYNTWLIDGLRFDVAL